MCALGTAMFYLKNATLSGQVYTYNLELVPHGTYPGISRSQLLPIYGNICAQLLIQPQSLIAPLAESQLDVFCVEEARLMQKMNCLLEGGSLKIFKKNNCVLILNIDQVNC